MLKNRLRKARGFALTEMLIVVIILAVLAGMFALTFGSSEDRAMATRIMSDLDSLRSAVLTYSNEQSWNRGAFDSSAGLDSGMINAVSLSPYLAKPIGENFRVLRVNDRLLAGYENHSKITAAVSERLARNAGNEGLLTSSGAVYTTGSSIYVNVR